MNVEFSKQKHATITIDQLKVGQIATVSDYSVVIRLTQDLILHFVDGSIGVVNPKDRSKVTPLPAGATITITSEV